MLSEKELHEKLIEYIGTDPDPVQLMRVDLAVAMRRQISLLEHNGQTDMRLKWCSALRKVLKDVSDVVQFGHPTSLRFVNKLNRNAPPEPRFKSKMKPERLK